MTQRAERLPIVLCHACTDRLTRVVSPIFGTLPACLAPGRRCQVSLEVEACLLAPTHTGSLWDIFMAVQAKEQAGGSDG
jgi:hypothetical protein